MTPTRQLFEQLTFAYYQRLKANGWWSPDEGDPTPEALFWRREDQPEMYGVAQIQAAWVGFQLAAAHYEPMLRRFDDCLQQSAATAGLAVGSDICKELPGVLKALIRKANP